IRCGGNTSSNLREGRESGEPDCFDRPLPWASFGRCEKSFRSCCGISQLRCRQRLLLWNFLQRRQREKFQQVLHRLDGGFGQKRSLILRYEFSCARIRARASPSRMSHVLFEDHLSSVQADRGKTEPDIRVPASERVPGALPQPPPAS